MKSHLRAIAHGLLLSLPIGVMGQASLTRELRWPSLQPVANASETKERAARPAEPGTLAFTGAQFDAERGDLPMYSEVVPLPGSASRVTAQLANARYGPLTAEERKAWPLAGDAARAPEARAEVVWHRKEPFALVTIEPFRRNPATGEAEKLLSFELDLATTQGGGGRPKSNYPDHSVLRNGEWYRVTVPRDGVYRMTYEFLRDLGVNVQGLSSDRINVYGNHHGLLPFVNASLPPTDLRPNAIEVVDGGDGVLGPGDHVLFYASGPLRWDFTDTLFRHTKHVYTDSASYFIGIDAGPPVRIADAAPASGPANRAITRFNDRQVIDRDLVNLIKSGRTWYGETFDLTTTYSYQFETPSLVSGAPVVLEFNGAARTLNSGVVTNSSSFAVSSGGAFSTSFNVQGVGSSSSGPVGRNFNQQFTWNASGGTVPVTVTFNKFDALTSVGWMNYLRLNCLRELRMSGDQLAFRAFASVGAGAVSEFILEQAGTVQRIWDITDPAAPARISYAANGQQRRFTADTESLRQFIAFRDQNYPVPTRVGRVTNQDLHATALPTDLVIVCPPEFRSAAQRLANARAQEGLEVLICSPQQVFNEFSSGMRDATAIKRFMKMLYDKAAAPEELPRYLLLFGDGSYNNISLAFSNQNWVPSYQTEDAIDYSRSYTSDDYFGLLDDSEGESTADLVDIGVGRIVAHSVQQANEVVDKILSYDRQQLLTASASSCSTTGDGGIPDWRTHVLFVSDDQEGDGFEGIIHMSQSDELARRVENEHPYLNTEKIYLDAYQQITTPGGERYPQAVADLRDKVQKGMLLVNYIGHGGEVGWAHERLLDNATIMNWTNKDRLPLFMTATCEFSRWDDPGRTSAGELVQLNPNGGGVALFTTTRLAYSSQNFTLANDFYDYAFNATDELGRDQRLGDVYRRTKRDIATTQGNLRNHRNFTLLGDPSMRMAQPRHTIRITSYTDTLGNPVDTLKALATVRISGFVDNGSGEPMTAFNGIVVPVVFDKEKTQLTLANDGGSPFSFGIRKSVIYRGRATVVNGRFSFTFVVPKDINYQVGPGRVACYAESATTNACGYDNDPLVGGTAANVLADDNGPRIELFMNDERFVRGGITDENPLLFARIFDENGINTVGSSIGHDLLATLNENSEQSIVLNDLYEADLDTYKSGQVRYRFNKLPEGRHTLRLKAWDTFNNSSEGTTEFVVAPSAELALAHVLNYPNPFTTYTQFFFEHNRPCTTLDVQLQVFTVSGRLVKSIGQRVACDGFRGEPLAWDGRDDFGDRLGRGVYVYRLKVTTPDGEKAEKFEKLVILR
jgi:hypothetical protein